MPIDMNVNTLLVVCVTLLLLMAALTVYFEEFTAAWWFCISACCSIIARNQLPSLLAKVLDYVGTDEVAKEEEQVSSSLGSKSVRSAEQEGKVRS